MGSTFSNFKSDDIHHLLVIVEVQCLKLFLLTDTGVPDSPELLLKELPRVDAAGEDNGLEGGAAADARVGLAAAVHGAVED